MLSLAYLLIATAGQRGLPMGYTSTGLKVNVVRAASYADSGHSRAFTQPGRAETRRLSIPCRLAVRETGPGDRHSAYLSRRCTGSGSGS